MVKEYQTWERGFEQYEAEFLTDQIALNGVTAHFAKCTDIIEDAHLRDFTMNALYFNLEDLSVKDPLGHGIKDIENKMLNTCDQTSLEQDPLRMLRAITIAATYDFDISQSVIGQI